MDENERAADPCGEACFRRERQRAAGTHGARTRSSSSMTASSAS